MATYTKVRLSGGTDGRNILVVATGTAGTLIHTATSTSGANDEIWLWAQNANTADLKLTLEYGGVTVPNDLVEVTIPAESGPVLVVPGWLLTNSLIVRAFAASANLVVINGFVNRIT